MKLSVLLKKLRAQERLTQKELAERLGYSAQFVSNWERGLSLPPPKCFKKLALALGTHESLFTRYLLRYLLLRKEKLIKEKRD